MEFADANIRRRDPGLAKSSVRGLTGHISACKRYSGAVEERGWVCCEALAGDQDSVLLEEIRSSAEEGFGHDDCSSCAVRSGAALKFGKGRMNHGRVENLGESVGFTELRIGILDRVEVVDAGYFCKI